MYICSMYMWKCLPILELALLLDCCPLGPAHFLHFLLPTTVFWKLPPLVPSLSRSPAFYASVMCISHPCGLSHCLVALLDVTVPFSPCCDSLPSNPTSPQGPTHTGTAILSPCSVLLSSTSPSSLRWGEKGCFYSPGREDVLLICRDDALFCIVQYIFGMYHCRLQYTVGFVLQGVAL